jgi:hypothetical protein
MEQIIPSSVLNEVHSQVKGKVSYNFLSIDLLDAFCIFELHDLFYLIAPEVCVVGQTVKE